MREREPMVHGNTGMGITSLINAETEEDALAAVGKLHCARGHASVRTMRRVVKEATLGQWDTLVGNVVEACRERAGAAPMQPVAVTHTRPPSRVGAEVYMDLLFTDESKGSLAACHLIDYTSRYSVVFVAPSKHASIITEGILQNWVGLFGPPMGVVRGPARWVLC